MRGLNVFGWVSAFVVAFLIVVFVVFSLFIANVLETDLVKIPGEVEALAAVFALIFGTAAVAGGAVATIKVASLGIEIYERQEYLERTQFIETRAKPSIDRFSNLVIVLSDTHVAAVGVHVYIEGLVSKLDDKGKAHARDQGLSPDLLMCVEIVAQRLVGLSDAIRDVMSHDFTHYSFSKSAVQIESKLDHINKSSLISNHEENKSALSVSKLSDIKGIIDIAIGKLRTIKKWNL